MVRVDVEFAAGAQRGLLRRDLLILTLMEIKPPMELRITIYDTILMVKFIMR
ncbi:MAG: hypothetical protein ACFFCW_12825 [Candidatus Hodarchaeota archaeon]